MRARLVLATVAGLVAALVAACTTTTAGSGQRTGAASTSSSSSTAGAGVTVSVSGSSGAGVTVSLSASAGSGATVSVSTKPGIFVGQWTGHGRALVVLGSGRATANYRVYKFCSQDPTPPCDNDTGNSITDGGRVELQIAQVRTENNTSTATAYVLSSSDPAYPVGKKETFVLSGDVIQSEFGSLCDAKASAAGLCGA